MFDRLVNIALICALCFCGIWLLAAHGVINSLRKRVEDEEVKREVLNKEKNDLEKALVRTRVQLNSLIAANSDLSDKIDELQKQAKAQEQEIERMKNADPKSVGISKERIDSISAQIQQRKAQLSSSKLGGTRQRDSFVFLIECTELLRKRLSKR